MLYELFLGLNFFGYLGLLVKVWRKSVAEWKVQLEEKVSKAAEQYISRVQGQKLQFIIISKAMYW